MKFFFYIRWSTIHIESQNNSEHLEKVKELCVNFSRFSIEFRKILMGIIEIIMKAVVFRLGPSFLDKIPFEFKILLNIGFLAV